MSIPRAPSSLIAFHSAPAPPPPSRRHQGGRQRRRSSQPHARKLEDEVAAILQEAAETDQAEDHAHGPARGDELPAELASPTGRLARLQQAKARLEAEAAERQRRYETRVAELAAAATAKRRQPRAHTSSREPATKRPTRGRSPTPPTLIAASSAPATARCRATTPKPWSPNTKWWSRPHSPGRATTCNSSTPCWAPPGRPLTPPTSSLLGLFQRVCFLVHPGAPTHRSDGGELRQLHAHCPRILRPPRGPRAAAGCGRYGCVRDAVGLAGRHGGRGRGGREATAAPAAIYALADLDPTGWPGRRPARGPDSVHLVAGRASGGGPAPVRAGREAERAFQLTEPGSVRDGRNTLVGRAILAQRRVARLRPRGLIPGPGAAPRSDVDTTRGNSAP